MEIYHDSHTQFLSTDGLDKHVGGVVPSVFRIDPDAVSDRVHAKLLHKSRAFGLLAGGIVELHPLVLHLGNPTDVCTLGKGGAVNYHWLILLYWSMRKRGRRAGIAGRTQECAHAYPGRKYRFKFQHITRICKSYSEDR